MKSKEFLKLAEANGWTVLRQKGSHVIYIKDGQTVVIPNHGSKELGKGLENKLRKQMGMK